MIRVADSRADFERCAEIYRLRRSFERDRQRVRDGARAPGGALAFVIKRGLAEVTQEVNVVRHRRRGLATALKRAQIHWAADHGYRELVSDMVEGNAAVRAVNERLGYRPLPPVFIVSGSVS